MLFKSLLSQQLHVYRSYYQLDWFKLILAERCKWNTIYRIVQALKLNNYKRSPFKLVYDRGENNVVADALSRIGTRRSMFPGSHACSNLPAPTATKSHRESSRNPAISTDPPISRTGPKNFANQELSQWFSACLTGPVSCLNSLFELLGAYVTIR